MSGGLTGNAPTGLYGWIKGNDARSVQFFALFALAVQALGALVLFLPLTLFDQGHSPLFAPLGYVERYVPAILALSTAMFGAQLFWYTETVKKRAGFHFVDGTDEPRLCRLIEPLIVLMDMTPPFVAVIESPACNAFACGISRKHAVVVVTRGLIDSLNDDELETVLAHELTHIRNDDIRMMAAANICMANLKELDKANVLQFRHWAAGVWCLAFPVFFPLMLFGGIIGQAAMRAAWRARFTIISSREFIADANAVQLTKNPAALASALTRIRGRETIPGLAAQDDAMMIAGRSDGPDATHPEVEDRVEALARVTGSMVFNAPGAAALSGADEAAALKRSRRLTARQRARRALAIDRFGMTRLSRIGFAVAVVLFLGIHLPELSNGRAMAAKFDIRPLAMVLGVEEVGCATPDGRSEECRSVQAKWQQMEGQRGTLVGILAGYNAERHRQGARHALTALNIEPGKMQPYTGQSGKLTGVNAEMNGQGSFSLGSGSFSSEVPERLMIAEVDQVGCFPAELLHGDPEGKFPVDRPPSGGFSLERLAANAEGALISRGMPGSREERDWLRGYAEQRRTALTAAYDLFGLLGLRMAQRAYETPAHAGMLSTIEAQAKTPEFTREMKPLDLAVMRALLRDPERFLPCPAVKHGA
jgi:Zn-dependent protease with chaperone function